MNKQLLRWAIAGVLLCPTLALANAPEKNLAAQKTVDIQLKTSDGKIIPAKVNPQDIKNVKTGDKVELFEMNVRYAPKT